MGGAESAETVHVLCRAFDRNGCGAVSAGLSTLRWPIWDMITRSLTPAVAALEAYMSTQRSDGSVPAIVDASGARDVQE